MSGFRFAGAQYSLVYGVANINSYFLDENVLQEPAANQQATWPRRMRHIIGKSEEQFGKTDENSVSLSARERYRPAMLASSGRALSALARGQQHPTGRDRYLEVRRHNSNALLKQKLNGRT